MRIGLFFSRVGGQVEVAVNLEELLAGYTADYFTSVCDDFFDFTSMQKMLAEIRQQDLEAVLLIGESSLNYFDRRSGDFVLNEIQGLGINPNRIAFVNLIEQLAMVHQGQKKAATRKAKLLIDVEIKRVLASQPLQVISVVPRKAVAVLGATVAGFLASERLLRKGFKVDIIDPRPDALATLPRDDEGLKPILAFVEGHSGCRLFHGATITDLYGYAGDYTVELQYGLSEFFLPVGAVIIANPGDEDLTRELRTFLHIDVDEQGFFKSRNFDTLRGYASEEGVFMAWNDVANFSATAAAADSAVLALVEFLERPEINHTIAISEVDRKLCGGCGTCVKTCLFHASRINPVDRVASIDPKRCKGCGNCVTACPTGARDLLTYPKNFLFQAIDILATCDSPGKMLFFLCEGGGYRSMDAVARAGLKYPVEVLPLRVRCGGAIDTQLILHAYKKGFAGVAILRCPEGHCSNIVGNTDLDRRANLFRVILRSRGIDTERLRIIDGLEMEVERCVEEIMDFCHTTSIGGGGAGE